MEIKDLQRKVDEINIYFDRKFGDERRDMMHLVKIGEEYGELCEAMLAEAGLQRDEKIDAHTLENVNEELADVIIAAITLARRRDIDLESMILDKLQKVEDKIKSV